MKATVAAAALALSAFCVQPGAAADEATDAAFAARDICIGVAAKFGHGNGLTFDAGKFKVDKGTNGQITIFENSVPLGQIPNFDYSNYTTCVSKFVDIFDLKMQKSESNRSLAIFNAAFELSNILSVGTCMQSTAMVGMYFGDMSLKSENAENVLGSDYFYKLLAATDRSLEKKIQRYLNQTATFSLESGVKYYRYGAYREIPYFDAATSGQYSGYLASFIDDELRPYSALGHKAASLVRLYGYAGVFIAFDRVFSAQPDPVSAQRRAAIRDGLRCIQFVYANLSATINQSIEDADIELNSEIPKIENLYRLTNEEIRLDTAGLRFVSELRKNIKSAR